MNTISEIANILKNSKSAVIFTHTRPDGDAVGSAMALSRALSRLNIPNEVVNDCEIPQKFFFLGGMEQVKREPTLNADTYICVDSSDEARLGALQNVYLAGAKRKTTVNIDHHVSNARYAKYNFVRCCSSNCENMLDLVQELGVPLDEKIASYLLVGMMTDSGCFTHNDVNGDSLRRASAVVDAGASVDKINYQIFRNQKKAQACLYAEVIGKIRFLLEDQFAVAVISQETLVKHGANADMTEGIVDYALNVDTVEVSVSLMEMKRNQYKASFRSKGKVNVNQVAGVYGGGGHILASGCMLFGELEEVLDRLRYTVSQYMEE